MRHAFSLVEVSLVLVIIGLVTGGILAGQSLIRSSELRSVHADVARFSAAANAFRDQYKGLPGDLRDATSYWGELDPVLATCQVTEAAGKPTCNGDGNGTLYTGTNATLSNEWFRFWQHLSNAGLIGGQYTGRSSAATVGTYGTTLANAPGSKIKNAAWFIAYDPTSGAAMHDVAIQRHNLRIGGIVANDWPNGNILSPEEALNIDTKTDDGKPGAGAVTAPKLSFKADCTNGDTANAAYRVDLSGPLCTLYFDPGF